MDSPNIMLLHAHGEDFSLIFAVLSPSCIEPLRPIDRVAICHSMMVHYTKSDANQKLQSE